MSESLEQAKARVAKWNPIRHEEPVCHGECGHEDPHRHGFSCHISCVCHGVCHPICPAHKKDE